MLLFYGIFPYRVCPSPLFPGVMDLFGHFFKIMTEADRTYNKVVKVMADAFQEAKGDPSLWHDPHFAAYGHTRNSYTNANSHPTIFDYIFLRKSTMDPGEIWVKSFSLPDLHIVKPTTQTQISISDHEGIASHIYLWKQ